MVAKNMVGFKKTPWAHSLLTLSVTLPLAVTGCVTAQPETASPQVIPLSSRPVANGASPSTAPLRYDWSSDRILQPSSGFQVTSYSGSVRASFDAPAIEQQDKTINASGDEFANEFAKFQPGATATNPNSPTTPAVARNTGFFLTESDSSVNFFALNETGQTLWQLSLHADGGKFVGTSPALGNALGTDRVLYAISDLGRLYAVDASSGVVRSFYQIAGDTFTNSSPFVVPGNPTDQIFLVSQEGRVYKFTFNGSSNTFSVNSAEFGGSDGIKIVSSGNTGKFSTSPLVIDKPTTGTLTNDYLYVGSEEGRVYKIRATDGRTPTGGTNYNDFALNLSTQPRSEGCQIKGTMAIDVGLDAAIVPCGSYLFKVKLNDNSTAPLSLLAQSPLLEVRDFALFRPTQILGPNINNRTLPKTTLLREPLPTEDGFDLEQPFGFRSGDYIKVTPRSGGPVYGVIDTIEDATVSLLDPLMPLPSPSPNPFLLGAEPIEVVNLAIRPTPTPVANATPTPVPTPTALGADPVTSFVVGNPEGLSQGDRIIFPTLPGQPVVTICSSSNAECDKDNSGANRYPGIELLPAGSGNANDLRYQITVANNIPGVDMTQLIQNRMASDRFVPFEKVQNRVVGNTNTTVKFQLGDVGGFQPGQVVRITHKDDSVNGRYEYGLVRSGGVNTSARTLELTAPLVDAPEQGARVEIVELNNSAFGRVSPSLGYSTGNILSSPVLRGNSQQVYIQHGNSLFELRYDDNTSFRDVANYLVLQSARLDQSNLSLSALSRSTPLALSNDKLITVDSDPTGKTGIFLNRVLLPLSPTSERLNDFFAIRSPNSLGDVPNRAETRPILFGSTPDFVLFGGGNGVVYKLHKDIAW